MAAPGPTVHYPDNLGPVGRPPHELSADEVAHVVGPTMETPQHTRLAIRNEDNTIPWIRSFDQTFSESNAHTVDEDGWFGCTIYTPYVRPVPAAIRCRAFHDLQHCIDIVLDGAPGVDRYTYNVCIPTRPQRHAGYGSFLRFPSSALGGSSRPMAAVIIDATLAGGNYFACYISRVLTYEALMSFIIPLTRMGAEPFVIHVGDRAHPHPLGHPVHFQDGDVVQVLRLNDVWHRTPALHEIFANRMFWGPLYNMPRHNKGEGVLVQYGTKQHFILSHQHFGSTLVTAIAERFQCSPDAFTLCSFRTPDLELHGEYCSHLTMVIDLPHAQREACRRQRRRDFFALCDLRGVGGRAWIMHSHTPLFHPPSIAALRHVYVPRNNRLATEEGTRQGEDVLLGDTGILTFFLAPTSSDEDGDGPSSDEGPARRPRPGGSLPPRGPGPTARRSHQSSDVVARRSRSRSRSGSGGPGDTGRLHALKGSGFAWRQIAMPWLEALTESCLLSCPLPFPTYCIGKIQWPKSAKGLGGPRLTVQNDSMRQSAEQGLQITDVEHTAPLQHDPPAVAERAPEVGEAQALAADASLLLGLIYAPEYIPDVVVQAITLPCSVGHAISAFAQRRDSSQAACFDQLFPAMPQPTRELVVMVAMPSWELYKVGVIFNCLAVNKTLFAAAVHPYLNKASLLIAAGLFDYHDYDIYVHGLLQPVDPDQWITLRSGMMLSVVLAGSGPGASWNLEDMLQDTSDWNHEAPIPGPPPPAGNSFWILTDGLPVLFQVEAGRRRSVQEDIVARHSYRPDFATLKATRPRVIDQLAYGHPTWAVLILTEARQTIPFPPARHPDYRAILVLDCRALLLGFKWQLVSQPRIALQELADQFADLCPATHLVVFKGAEILDTEDGLAIMVTDGLLLKVEFAEGSEGGESSHHDSMQVDDGDHITHEDVDSADDTEGSASHGCAGSDAEIHSPLRERSRSPRHDASVSPQQQPASQHTYVLGVMAPGYRTEFVTVQIGADVPLHAITVAAQTRRAAASALAFPLLQATAHQPGDSWGLYVATPIWEYEGVIVCVDMFTHWGRTFAMVVSAQTTCQDLLICAGLAPAADVDVYINCLGPLAETVTLRDGDCVTVVWKGAAAPQQRDLASVLESMHSFAAAPCSPSDGHEDFYCLVSQDANRLFTLRPNRATYYKSDIAARIDCDVRELLLVPSAPQPQDADMFGHPCRSVVAALKTGYLPPNLPVCAVMLDARRILRGWLPMITHDGWISVTEVRHNLSRHLPTSWQVMIEDIPEDQDWIYCDHGMILTAYCVPTPVLGPRAGAQEELIPESSPPATAPTAAESHPASDGHRAVTRDTLPPSSSATNASPEQTYAAGCKVAGLPAAMPKLGSKVSLWLVLLCGSVIGGRSMHIPRSPNTGDSYSVEAGNPISRVDMWLRGEIDHAHTPGHPSSTPILCLGNSKSSTERSFQEPMIPNPNIRASLLSIATPCRPKRAKERMETLHSPDGSTGELTVLQDIFSTHGEQFYFDAWTLLETLSEHFADSVSHLLPHRPSHSYGKVDCRFDRPSMTSEPAILFFQELIPVHLPGFLRGSPPPQSLMLAARRNDDPVRVGTTDLGFSWAHLCHLLEAEPNLRHWDSFFPSDHHARLGLPDALAGLSGTVDDSRLICYTDGSFYPPQGEHPARAGWAFIMLHPGSCSTSWSAGQVPSLSSGSEHKLSAYIAECYAMIMAYMTAALRFSHLGIDFRGDCQAAIGIAQGTMAYCEGRLSHVLANAIVFRRAITFRGDTAAYVPGHVGEFFNEAADTMAKWGATQTGGAEPDDKGPLPRYWLEHGGTRLAWAAVVLRQIAGDPTLPPLEQDLGDDTWHGGLTPCQLIEPFIPSGSVGASHQGTNSASATLVLTILSHNTLTLGATLENSAGAGVGDPGIHFRPGRAAILAEQLHRNHIMIAALQETRGQEGQTTVGSYLRYSSGAVKGQFGTEVWLHKTLPFLQFAESEDNVCFTPGRLNVVHKDPRRLLIKFQFKSWRILIASLHAPHRACESPVIHDWWTKTRQLVYKYASAAFVILAGDANASVGSITGVNLGHVAAEAEDLPGQYWRELLHEVECFLPCTFEESQHGDTVTYVQKRNGQGCRPDMIGVPLAWGCGEVAAWTAPEIHAALSTQDHTATCVRISLNLKAPQPGKMSARKKLTPEALLDPRNHAAVTAALERMPKVSWETSSHAHAAIVVHHLQRELGEINNKAMPRPRHPYLTESTWQLQRQVTAWKRSMHRLQQRKKSQLKAILFDAWKTSNSTPAQESPLQCRWLLKAILSELAHMYHVSILCRRLRQACRADRDQYVADLASQVAHNPCSEVYGALHRLLCHKRKKPYMPEPLPLILDASAEPCQDAQSVQARWRQHFGSMEGGIEADFATLPKTSLHRKLSYQCGLRPAVLWKYRAFLTSPVSCCQRNLVRHLDQMGYLGFCSKPMLHSLLRRFTRCCLNWYCEALKGLV